MSRSLRLAVCLPLVLLALGAPAEARPAASDRSARSRARHSDVEGWGVALRSRVRAVVLRIRPCVGRDALDETGIGGDDASPPSEPLPHIPARTAPSPPDPLAEDASPEPDDGSPMGFRLGFVVEALWIPALLFDTDVSDDNTFRPTGRVEARARAGLGWGLRAGPSTWRTKGKRWFVALGGMYVTSEHHERKTDGKARIHLGFAELWGTRRMVGEDVSLILGWSLGIGGGAIHFTRVLPDVGGAAGNLGLLVGVRFFQRLELRAGATGFILGYPGNTLAVGGFFSLEAAISF